MDAANTAHVFRDGPMWLAKVGHPAEGVMVSAPTPELALGSLAEKLRRIWWPFDHAADQGSLQGGRNAIVLWRTSDDLRNGCGTWIAHLGPPPGKHHTAWAMGRHPALALARLAEILDREPWQFDPEWRP